jgi:hypothetical protein
VPRVFSPACLLLVTLLGLFATGGASCPNMVQQYTQPLPRALQPNASLDQVIDVVNQNSSKVHSFYAPRATVSVPGFPGLRSTVAFQRERNFRLKGETSFTGPEIDLGSNPELFWLWIRRNQPPALLFCRHDQFAQASARQVVPIEPEWLIQALGLVSFEPNLQHQGPFPVQAGRIEIRSAPPPGVTGSPRITVIDDTRGIVLEQHVYDTQGTRLATAIMKNHMRDPQTGAILPRHVDIQWPPAKIDFGIELGDVQINTLGDNSPELWTKPTYAGYGEINLAEQFLAPPQQGAPLQPGVPAAAGLPTRMPPVHGRY